MVSKASGVHSSFFKLFLFFQSSTVLLHCKFSYRLMQDWIVIADRCELLGRDMRGPGSLALE